MSPFPPVVRLVEIRDTALSVDEVVAAVSDAAAGGVTLFVGAVRDHDENKSVTGLEYSAHPTALAQLTEVAEACGASLATIKRWLQRADEVVRAHTQGGAP